MQESGPTQTANLLTLGLEGWVVEHIIAPVNPRGRVGVEPFTGRRRIASRMIEKVAARPANEGPERSFAGEGRGVRGALADTDIRSLGT